MKYWISISALLTFSSAQPAFADDWTGLYGTAGVGLSRVHVSGDQGDRSDDSHDLNGFAGLGLGGNLQYGSFVIGFEGDIAAMGNQTSLTLKNTVAADQDWFATARARVGMPMNQDLFFVTGGWAAMSVEASTSEGDDRKWMNGWTIGAGVERKISEHINLRLEGLYMNFEKERFDTDPIFDIDLDSRLVIARVGMTYGF